jgi:hypothetical protein
MSNSICLLLERTGWTVVVFAAGLAYAVCARAQVTQVNSFETGLEGYVQNGGNLTLSVNSNPSFVSDGSNSLKVEFGMFGTFSAAETSELKPELDNPPGVDLVRFDFINTNRFAPEMPGPSDPTFAQVGVNMFGIDPADPETVVHIQFQAQEQPIGNLEPGTHEIEIDVSQGGLNVSNSQVQGFDDWFGDGPGQLTPIGFALYFNKNFGITPSFAWTFYVDNIRVGKFQTLVEGDYNGNGTVDAADYTLWRNNLGLTGGASVSQGDGDGDGDVTLADYGYWKTRFGNTGNTNGGGSRALAAGAVPEASSFALLICAAVTSCCARRRRIQVA